MVVLAALSAPGIATTAQDAPPLPGKLILGDLQSPRGLAFDAAGNLIVAIAGNGGTDFQVEIPSPEQGAPVMKIGGGLTGQVLSIAPDGKATPWISGLPSYATETETTGIYRAIPQGDALWLVFNGAGSANVGAYWMDSVVELDAKTLAVKTVINLNNIEATLDPDKAGYDTNVADIAWGADGTLYIVDAGGNDLLSWTAADGLKVVHAWMDNPVPTSIEIAANGDMYIGFLGAGVAPGAGKIERWSGGKLAETYGGLTAVTDLLLDGDKLYAVQLLLFSDQGPGAGNVVMVDASGAKPVAEGLLAPFAIAKGPDGSLYVSFGTIAFAPGMTGGVVKLDAMK
jgi:hypothetical protein